MQSILEILDRSATADDLLRTLLNGKSCWISGPSGTGKTELARWVAEHWPDNKNAVHWIIGDQDQAGTSFLAAHRTLAATRARRAARAADQDLPSAAFRLVPWAGAPIAALAKSLIARVQPSGPDFISAEMQDVLAGFQRICISDHVLLIVDNVHWLDAGTSELLLRMTSPEVSSGYPFIGRTALIFIETAEQQTTVPASTIAALKRQTAATFSLGFPTRAQFVAVLQCFGLDQSLESDIYDRLYELTRGHLKLSKEIVHLLKEDTAQSALRREQLLSPEEIAQKLMALRLGALGPNEDDLEKLLSIASCIGQTFSRRELECAFSNPGSFGAALDIARREELVSGEGDLLQFAHEIVHAALKRLVGFELAPFHDKLAECVRIIRPGDYKSRLRHSLQAKNSTRSASLAFALLLQERRGEASFEIVAERPSEGMLGDDLPAFRAATSALTSMDAGRPEQAIRLLAPFYEDTGALVHGEIAYLMALNYYKRRNHADYQNARALLEPWITRRDEGELWHRLMLTLAVVHASLGDQRASSQILRRVRVYLERSADYDSAARAKIQILNRKADVFYPIEVAAVLIEKAVEYFGPPLRAELPRNGFQYVAALINSAGNCYVRGEFVTSFERAESAVRFMSALAERMRLPEAYKAFNNYAIAGVRGGRLGAQEALQLLNDVSNATGDQDRLDYSLLSVNRGVLNLIAGSVSTADDLLARTYDGCKIDGLEGYYLYFAASNYAATRYLLGFPGRALELIDEAEACLDEIPSELGRSMELRHRAMRQAIENSLASDPVSWDAHPKSLFGSSGPHVTWQAFGNGVVMSDIQVWSES